MPTKAEIKAQKAEEYAKWYAELVALPGVQDIGGTATGAICGQGGHGKKAFPMSCSAGNWLTAQQALDSHKGFCWVASPPNSILFVPEEDANSANTVSNDVGCDDEESAPDWREKAVSLLMKGVVKQSNDKLDEMLNAVRYEQLGKRCQGERERLEYWRNIQLADRYGQRPWFHNGLDSEYERWNRPAAPLARRPVCPRSRSRDDRPRCPSCERRCPSCERRHLRHYEPRDDRRRREPRDDRRRCSSWERRHLRESLDDSHR